jgi:hypothetical protein
MTQPSNRRLATEAYVDALTAADVGAQPAGDYATSTDLSTGLAGKVNSSTYTAGLAAKQDTATLPADVASHVADGSALDTALRAALGSRQVLTAYDDFTGEPDGALAGQTRSGGLTWGATGAQPPAITGGRLTSSGVGYAYLGLTGTPTVLACGVEFTNPGTDYPMTMAWVTGSSFDLTNLTGHFNFGGNGFRLTLKRDATFYTLLEGEWKRPLSAGVVHAASISIVGDSFVVQVDGEVYASPPDSRTRALAGSYVLWEPNTAGASQAKLAWVGAWTEDETHTPQVTEVAAQVADYSRGLQGRLVGNRGEMWEARLGRTPQGGQPGISFGAETIVTELVSAVSAGATTLSTRTPIPPGCTVVIDEGAATEETRTSTGFPGETSAPYTLTVTAGMTSAHPARTIVVATVPADKRAEMYLNQSNGFWYMPNLDVVVFPGEKAYLGGDHTQYLEKNSGGVVGSAGVGAGKGAFRAGDGWATAARPAPADVGVGSQGYDTDLHKPIWSDGTNWRDAAGTVV